MYMPTEPSTEQFQSRILSSAGSTVTPCFNRSIVYQDRQGNLVLTSIGLLLRSVSSYVESDHS